MIVIKKLDPLRRWEWLLRDSPYYYHTDDFYYPHRVQILGGTSKTPSIFSKLESIEPIKQENPKKPEPFWVKHNKTKKVRGW